VELQQKEEYWFRVKKCKVEVIAVRTRELYRGSMDSRTNSDYFPIQH
jgi:hypothetical protein